MKKSSVHLSAITSSFRTRAIRTAVLIDNEYPSFSDYSSFNREKLANFRQSDRAHAFYAYFKGLSIMCDIVNSPDDWTNKDYDRVRKSDLIVLDYHLSSGSDDPSAAVNILSSLADSEHFNLVVVHTMEKDLGKVWLQVAANLRGGWKQSSEHFPDKIQYELWDDFSSSYNFDEVERALLVEYLTTGVLVGKNKELIKKHAIAAGLERSYQNFLSAFVDSSIKSFVCSASSVVRSEPRCLSGKYMQEGPIYLLCGNVFVTFYSKSKGMDDPANLLNCLDRALELWSPGIVQLVMSDIQNNIEDSCCAFREMTSLDKKTEAGLVYFALRELQAEAKTGGGANGFLHLLHRRAYDGLKDSFLSIKLEAMVRDLLKEYVSDLNLSTCDDAMLARIAQNAASCPNSTTHQEILHSLNCYMSSTCFSGAHVTTGTVFVDSKTGEWWVCVSPSCDMVPRRHADGTWHRKLHPLKPMVVLKLAECKLADRVGVATQGRTVFVLHNDKHLALQVCDENTRAPNSYVMFASDEGRVENMIFKAFVPHAKGESLAFSEGIYQVVSQLREDNANLLLQNAAHHASRVGVDYENYKPTHFIDYEI